MRKAISDIKPDRFEDIIALVALYRPGPMANIPVYGARKFGLEKPDYLHDSIEPVLKETYGIIVYQEQVMQIAQILSGYSLGEADLLRRAMGKKIKAEMDKQRVRFVDGAVERGCRQGARRHHLRPLGQVRRLWVQQEPCRRLCAGRLSDGLSQGQSSCGVHGGVDDARAHQYRQAHNDFRREAIRLGITVEPPSVNRSRRGV